MPSNCCYYFFMTFYHQPCIYGPVQRSLKIVCNTKQGILAFEITTRIIQITVGGTYTIEYLHPALSNRSISISFMLFSTRNSMFICKFYQTAPLPIHNIEELSSSRHYFLEVYDRFCVFSAEHLGYIVLASVVIDYSCV